MKFTKTCRVCEQDKTADAFYKHSSTKDKLRSECIECWNKSSLDYYIDNKERVVSKRKAYHFKKNYGLSIEDLEQMKQDQDYKCKICDEEKALVVDHDHSSGHVRNLLCSDCNLGLSHIENNPGWAEKAIAYLDKHN